MSYNNLHLLPNLLTTTLPCISSPLTYSGTFLFCFPFSFLNPDGDQSIENNPLTNLDMFKSFSSSNAPQKRQKPTAVYRQQYPAHSLEVFSAEMCTRCLGAAETTHDRLMCISGMPGRKEKWVGPPFKKNTETGREFNCHHLHPWRAKGIQQRCLLTVWPPVPQSLLDELPRSRLRPRMLLPALAIRDASPSPSTRCPSSYEEHTLVFNRAPTAFASVSCSLAHLTSTRHQGGSDRYWLKNKCELHISRPKHKSTRNYRTPPTCT